jgi:hypothetical protein
MINEKRDSDRVTVNLVVKWDSLSGTYEAKLEDISLGGCFINTTGQVEVNEDVNLEVLLPSGEWLTLKGRVTAYQPTIGFGVAFSGLTEKEENAVKKLCNYPIE